MLSLRQSTRYVKPLSQQLGSPAFFTQPFSNTTTTLKKAKDGRTKVKGSTRKNNNNNNNNNNKIKPVSMYCWGTSKKGTIPVQTFPEEGRKHDVNSGSLLNLDLFKSGTVTDQPTKIDLEKAFGIDNKTVTIRDVVCGPESTGVILSDNTAFTFGANKNGQLGHGHKNDVVVPTLLTLPDSSSLCHDKISKIRLGSNFTAIVDTNNDLYTCGYNGSTLKDGVGCLGHGYFPEEYLDSPTLVESLVEDGCSVADVAVGNAHMVVLTTQGEVLTCGSAQWGRTGNLEAGDQLFLEPVEMLVSESDICQIDSGKDFSLALSERDGIVFVWGRNEKGQCGTGSGLSVEMYAMEPMPVPIEGMLEGRKVVKVSAGHTHAAALTDKGELFVWGMGIHHQPELVTSLIHTKIVDVKCGKDYTIVVDEEGKIYSFGSGKSGVLGLSSQKKASTPTLIDDMIGVKISQIDAGWNHVACIVEGESIQ